MSVTDKVTTRYSFLMGRRREGWLAMLSKAEENFAKIVVETGCIRQHDDWGAGMSTLVLKEFCEGTGAELITIDNDSRHLNIAREICGEEKSIYYACVDSVDFLRYYTYPIDLLYLDSLDFYPEIQQESQFHALEEFQEAEDKLHKGSVVGIDDCQQEKGGKGGLLVPFLERRGWKRLYSGYQEVFYLE